MSNPASQLAAQIFSSKGLRPTSEWLSYFLSNQRPSTPMQSLVHTAQFRLLASDITSSLSRHECFPPDVANPQIKEQKLSGTIIIQVLGIEDISKSRWEQIEAIEAIERGEGTKGREIIRVTATEEESDGTEGNVNQKGGIHKLHLQDAAGNQVYGLELKPVEGVGLGMNIGCKMRLKDATVGRGVIMLEPGNVTIIGGKIDALHHAWKESRKAELRKAIAQQEL